MSEYMIDGALLTSIAEEVRNVDGSSSALTPAQMATRLNAVKSSIGAALLALTGNNASTLSVNVGDGQYYHYRAKMTDVDGGSAYSDVAMLSVAGYIAIKKQPVDVTARVGDTVTHSVVAVGDGLTYQWQRSENKGATWLNCTSTGAYTANWTFEMFAAYDGIQYRCVITDVNGNTRVTNAVTLTVGTAPVISTQPKSVTVAPGKVATFSVVAEGSDLSYQWSYLKPGTSTWTNVAAASGKTAEYSLTVEERHNGYQYRVTVSDSSGSAVSEIATLTVGTIVITKQPVDVTANVGDTATFTVEAEDVAVYQWQVSADSGTTWRDIPLTDAKYAVNSGNTVHDLADLIAGIRTTLVPPWATEFETAQVSVTSSSKTLSVPCTMSAAPTSHILFVSIYPTMSHTRTHHVESVSYYTQISGDAQYTWRLRYVGHIITQSGDRTIDIKEDVKVGTWTLANGIATLEAQDVEAYYTGHTYNIIMWR